MPEGLSKWDPLKQMKQAVDILRPRNNHLQRFNKTTGFMLGVSD